MAAALTSIRVGVIFAEAIAAPESVWSLRDAGFDVVVIARRGSRPAATRVRRVRVAEVHAPESDARRCREELVRVCRDMRLDMIFPLDDAGLFVCQQEALGPRLLGPVGQARLLTLDKELQIEAARAAGFAIPETQVVVPPEPIAWTGGFPVILKPADAISLRAGVLTKGPSRLCADRHELETALRSLPAGQRYVAQQWVPGEGRGVFGLMVDGRVFAWSGHRRVRMMNPAGSGSSACAPADVPGSLQRVVSSFLQQIEWQGLFMVELLVDEQGRAWFVELNGRPWGSMALARQRGLEYPAWVARQAVDPGFRPANLPVHSEVTLSRNLAYELLHLLFVARGPGTTAQVDWPTLWSALRDVLRIGRGHRWYNWRRGEARVLCRDVLWTLRRILRRSP